MWPLRFNIDLKGCFSAVFQNFNVALLIILLSLIVLFFYISNNASKIPEARLWQNVLLGGILFLVLVVTPIYYSLKPTTIKFQNGQGKNIELAQINQLLVRPILIQIFSNMLPSPNPPADGLIEGLPRKDNMENIKKLSPVDAEKLTEEECAKFNKKIEETVSLFISS